MDKKLVIMRGIQGCGKSSLAKELGKNGKIFSTDGYFMRDGKYDFNINQLGIAHIWNRNRVEEAMKQNEPLIVVDNCNIKIKDFRNYLLLAKNYNYKVEFAEPNWSPELKTPEGKWNFDFIKGRNVHNVPDDVVKKVIDSFDYKDPNETDDDFVDRILKN